MSSINCFDIVEFVADEATKKFHPQFVENSEHKDKLKKSCAIIDILTHRFICNGIDASVDQVTHDIEICVEFEAIEISDNDDEFFDLMRQTKRVVFKHGGDDSVVIGFFFDGYWEENI